jgi:hypothetical protein
VLTAVVAFIACLLFVPATPYWLDSPEFIAAASNLGLPHPPGHPSMVILLKLFLLFPVGDASFRANLFSAFFAAVAAGLTAGLSRMMAAEVLGKFVKSGRASVASAIIGVASGLLFAGTRSVFIQAMAAEVYTFHAALILGAVYVLLKGRSDARIAMVAGVLFGLALANHHLLAVLAFPAIFAAFWKGRSSVRGLLWAGGAAAFVAAGCYLYMPVRAALDAWPAWASASSWAGFIWYASAAIFSGSVGGFEQAGSSVGQNIGLAFVLLGESLGPLVLVMALGGMYQVVRTRAYRVALVVFLLLAGSLASKVMMGILDPANPDDHGYFLLALSSLSILAPQLLLFPLAAWFFAADSAGSRSGAVGRVRPVSAGKARLLKAVAAVAFVLVAVTVGNSFRGGFDVGRERSRFDDTDAVAAAAWGDIPVGAAAFVSHYPVFFVLQYQQEVEGVRPDVTLVQESLYFKARGGQWYARTLATRDESLGPLVANFLSSGTIAWSDLTSLASSRPVMLEASPDFKAVWRDIAFDGWFFRVNGDPLPDGIPPVPVTAADAAVIRAAALDAAGQYATDVQSRFASRAATNVETRRVIIRNLASSADWMEKSGDVDSAKALYLGALGFNPQDRTLNQKVSALP